MSAEGYRKHQPPTVNRQPSTINHQPYTK